METGRVTKKLPRQTNLPKPAHVSRRGDGPNPIDIHVGVRLRHARAQAGASQETLATAVGITFQQLQKYERGSNRISASRLFNLAQALRIGVEFFFDGLATVESNRPTSDQSLNELVQLKQREALDLVRIYHRVQDAQIRNLIVDLIEALGKRVAAESDLPA